MHVNFWIIFEIDINGCARFFGIGEIFGVEPRDGFIIGVTVNSFVLPSE